MYYGFSDALNYNKICPSESKSSSDTLLSISIKQCDTGQFFSLETRCQIVATNVACAQLWLSHLACKAIEVVDRKSGRCQIPVAALLVIEH